MQDLCRKFPNLFKNGENQLKPLEKRSLKKPPLRLICQINFKIEYFYFAVVNFHRPCVFAETDTAGIFVCRRYARNAHYKAKSHR